MKTCTKCFQTKELSEFHFRFTRNSHFSVCILCRNKQARQYYLNNRNYISKRNGEYRRNNRHIYNMSDAKRQANRFKATPPWYDDVPVAMIYAIAAAYRRQGRDVNVDHIIPLRGKLVSGLHCAENLQILNAAENRSKCNKFAV